MLHDDEQLSQRYSDYTLQRQRLQPLLLEPSRDDTLYNRLYPALTA